MAEEIKTTQEPEVDNPADQNPFGAQDYLKALEEIRKGTVEKDKYDKLAEENRQLVKSLANGSMREQEQESHVSSSEVEARLFAKRPKYRNDLEYFTDVLLYRDALIAEGQEDPFLPLNHDYVPTQADAERAEEIAEALKGCVEYADGDPSIFTSELKRRGVNINTRR